MPSLEKRILPSGKHTWRIHYRINGKQKKYNIGNCDKRTAERILKQFCIQLGNQTEPNEEIQGKRLSDFIGEYIDKSTLVKAPRTLIREKKVFENFCSFTGDIRLNEITPNVMENYRRFRLDSGISPSTVNLEFRHLKVAFNAAKRWKLIAENPLDGIRYIRVAQSEYPRYLSLEDIQRVRNAFRNTDFENLVDFYLGTGARLGEGLSLRWSDLDLKKGLVTIKGINAKGKRNRVISLNHSPMLLDILRNMKKRGDGKVFGPQDKKGKELPQWSEWRVGRHISKVLTSIGLPWATCHTFRHTFASHLVMAGVPLYTVQKLLGHAQIDTTMIYAHLAPEHNEAMMARLPYAQTMEDTDA